MNTASELDANKVDIMKERFIESMPQHAGDHQERLDRSQGGQAMSNLKWMYNPEWEYYTLVSASELREADKEYGIDKLKRELIAANERIKRLEDIIDRAANRFFSDGPDGQTAAEMLKILSEKLRRIEKLEKEAKP